MNAEVGTRAVVLPNYFNFYPRYYIGNTFSLCFVFQTHNWTKELPGQDPSVSMHIYKPWLGISLHFSFDKCTLEG